MNKMTYIVLGIIIIAVIFFFLKGKYSETNQEDFFISTASQSSNRIEKLGLNKRSEDVSHFLDESKLNIPKVETNYEDVEYKADSSRHWILNLKIPDETIIKQEKLYEIFDLDWRTNYSSSIFGHSPEDNKWTYALAGDAPQTYNKIQVAINILDIFNEEKPNYDFKKLKKYVTELKKRLISHSLDFEIQELESKESVIEKIKKAEKLNELYNKDILIALKSQDEYNGKEAWDVLQCLGLNWGDGDLFHWNNSSEYASDQHFSVWTSTQPGYFLPEQIKKGNMNPENLVFGFSIPRSADPINVYKALMNSIKYCQKRLGGQIINRDGKPFNEKSELIQLEELVKNMIDNGITPGSDNSLMTY